MEERYVFNQISCFYLKKKQNDLKMFLSCSERNVTEHQHKYSKTDLDKDSVTSCLSLDVIAICPPVISLKVEQCAPLWSAGNMVVILSRSAMCS